MPEGQYCMQHFGICGVCRIPHALKCTANFDLFRSTYLVCYAILDDPKNLIGRVSVYDINRSDESLPACDINFFLKKVTASIKNKKVQAWKKPLR